VAKMVAKDGGKKRDQAKGKERFTSTSMFREKGGGLERVGGKRKELKAVPRRGPQVYGQQESGTIVSKKKEVIAGKKNSAEGQRRMGPSSPGE